MFLKTFHLVLFQGMNYFMDLGSSVIKHICLILRSLVLIPRRLVLTPLILLSVVCITTAHCIGVKSHV